jgi:hypothetical protein
VLTGQYCQERDERIRKRVPKDGPKRTRYRNLCSLTTYKGEGMHQRQVFTTAAPCLQEQPQQALCTRNNTKHNTHTYRVMPAGCPFHATQQGAVCRTT